jgi:hypothetical protein
MRAFYDFGPEEEAVEELCIQMALWLQSVLQVDLMAELAPAVIPDL